MMLYGTKWGEEVYDVSEEDWLFWKWGKRGSVSSNIRSVQAPSIGCASNVVYNTRFYLYGIFWTDREARFWLKWGNWLLLGYLLLEGLVVFCFVWQIDHRDVSNSNICYFNRGRGPDKLQWPNIRLQRYKLKQEWERLETHWKSAMIVHLRLSASRKTSERGP